MDLNDKDIKIIITALMVINGKPFIDWREEHGFKESEIDNIRWNFLCKAIGRHKDKKQKQL